MAEQNKTGLNDFSFELPASPARISVLYSAG